MVETFFRRVGYLLLIGHSNIWRSALSLGSTGVPDWWYRQCLDENLHPSCRSLQQVVFDKVQHFAGITLALTLGLWTFGPCNLEETFCNFFLLQDFSLETSRYRKWQHFFLHGMTLCWLDPQFTLCIYGDELQIDHMSCSRNKCHSFSSFWVSLHRVAKSLRQIGVSYDFNSFLFKDLG